MATELTLTGTASANATLVGSWELRAGSQDTEEWLDGAADVSYPGGGPGTFHPSNTDGATGYDPAPKLAMITLGSTTDGQTIILGGGATSILGFVVSGGTANNAQTIAGNHAALTITFETTGTVTSGQLLVLYN